jgi:hypothetical protein
VRLPTEWRERISFLPVTVEVEDEAGLTEAIIAAITTWRRAADNG